MNPMLLSPEFDMPEDGWYQIAPQGEFPHPSTGLCQILDETACQAIAADFTLQAAAPNFGGVLVDYDHFSFDQDKPSEAAGWIVAIEHRPGSGLWARIRWTDTGEAAVRGGRYRFISPVWRREDCDVVFTDRIRPLRLTNAALTNSPNILGMAPLTNTARLTADAAAVIRNRIIANAMQPGNDRQRKAVMAKMKTGGGKRLWTDVADKPDPNRQARLDAAVGKAKAAAAAAGSKKDAPYGAAADYRASLGLGPKGDVVTGGSRKADPGGKAPNKLKPGRSSAGEGVGTTPSAAMDKTVPLNARLLALDAKVKSDIETYGDSARGSNRLDAIALAQEILGPAEAHAKRSAGMGTASMSAAGAVAQTYSDKLNRIVNGILSGRGLGDLLSTLNNRELPEDQRRAMFARLNAGGMPADWRARAAAAPDAPGEIAPSPEAAEARARGRDAEFLDVPEWRAGEYTQDQWEALSLDDRFKLSLVTGTPPGIGFPAASGAGILARAKALLAKGKSAAPAVKVAAPVAQAAANLPADLLRAAAQNPAMPAADLGYFTKKTVGQLVIDLQRESAAYAASKAAAAAAPTAKGARYLPGETIGLYGNRSPMSDDQRRAMFAKMGQGGTGFRTASAPAAPAPRASVFARPGAEPTTRPSEALYHSTTFRDHEARIERYQAERDKLQSTMPSKPEPRTFNTVDPRALQTDLMRQGKPLNDITAAVRAANENNSRVKSELAAIEDGLRRKGVSKDRLASEVAKELERIAKEYDKDVETWQKTVASTESKIAAIDLKIEEERIRQTEAEQAEAKRQWNAAVKEAVAEDKARAAAELKAAADQKKADDAAVAAKKKADEEAAKAAAAATADPIKENATIKARNKAYVEAIYRGDVALAEKLAPGVDHERNSAALTARLPAQGERASPRNQKALADILKTYETINPDAW